MGWDLGSSRDCILVGYAVHNHGTCGEGLPRDCVLIDYPVLNEGRVIVFFSTPYHAAEAGTGAIRGDHPAAGASSSSSSSGDAEDATTSASGGGGGGGGLEGDGEGDGEERGKRAKGGKGSGGGGGGVGSGRGGDGDKEDGALSKAEQCENMSAKLEELVDEWSGLVRMGGFERRGSVHSHTHRLRMKSLSLTTEVHIKPHN